MNHCIARNCGKEYDPNMPESRNGLRSFWQRYCPACRALGNAGVEVIVNQTPAEKFFYEHAGYSYDPKTETAEQGKSRGAVELARAEEYAAGQDWEYIWESDESGCIGCDCQQASCDCFTGARHETLVCVLQTPSSARSWEVLASLGGICGATPSYMRVVKAELALEAMHEQEQKQEQLRASVVHMNS